MSKHGDELISDFPLSHDLGGLSVTCLGLYTVDIVQRSVPLILNGDGGWVDDDTVSDRAA